MKICTYFNYEIMCLVEICLFDLKKTLLVGIDADNLKLNYYISDWKKIWFCMYASISLMKTYRKYVYFYTNQTLSKHCKHFYHWKKNVFFKRKASNLYKVCLLNRWCKKDEKSFWKFKIVRWFLAFKMYLNYTISQINNIKWIL